MASGKSSTRTDNSEWFGQTIARSCSSMTAECTPFLLTAVKASNTRMGMWSWSQAITRSVHSDAWLYSPSDSVCNNVFNRRDASTAETSKSFIPTAVKKLYLAMDGFGWKITWAAYYTTKHLSTVQMVKHSSTFNSITSPLIGFSLDAVHNLRISSILHNTLYIYFVNIGNKYFPLLKPH